MSDRARVVCSPNAFKGTMTALDAAAALADGVRDAGGEAVTVPMADGGDGTLEVLLAAAPSGITRTQAVRGPMGVPVSARLGWLDAATAVVELAEAAGLRLLGGATDPLGATSYGAGELIAAALAGGATRIIVGVGGSACTDGGAGMLGALGARLLDATRNPIPPGGIGLSRLAIVDLSQLDPRLAGCELEVACDVDNPLLGDRGAAAVFAPQKGANAAEVEQLAAGLARLAAVLERDHGTDPALRDLPGAGAAGGCGYGLAVIGARLVRGAVLVADAVRLDPALADCRLAITGEGRLDGQTAAGKAPMEVALRAARAGVPCAAVAGIVESVPEGFAPVISLADIARPGEDPMSMPGPLLRRAAASLLAG